MDFFRKVFRSDSKQDLPAKNESSSESSLFGGLDVNETTSNESLNEETPFDSSQPQLEDQSTSNYPNVEPKVEENHHSNPEPSAFSFINSPPSTQDPIVNEEPKSPTKYENQHDNVEVAGVTEEIGQKRIKKRTPTVRIGYAVESLPADQDAKSPTDENTSTQNISPDDSDRVSDDQTVHVDEISSPTSLDTENSLVEPIESTKDDISEPISNQMEINIPEKLIPNIETLKTKIENSQVLTRHLLHQLRDGFVEKIHQSSALWSDMILLETRISELRSQIKVASDEEKYDLADALKAEVESQIQKLSTVQLQISQFEDHKHELETKSKQIIMDFVSSQSSLLEELKEAKEFKRSEIANSQESLVALESELTSTLSSKMELLDERIADLRSELERITEKEQKIDQKISASSKNIAEELLADKALQDELEKEVEQLRQLLAAKESQLSAVNSRIEQNQSKVDKLREEHAEYLDDLLRDKNRKMEQKAALAEDKVILESQLESHNIMIADKKAEIAVAEETISNISSEIEQLETMISNSQNRTSNFAYSFSISVPERYLSNEKTTSIKAKLEVESDKLQSLTVAAAIASSTLRDAQAEQEKLERALKQLEQSKDIAVASKDYKQAAKIKGELASVQEQISVITAKVQTASKEISIHHQATIDQQAVVDGLNSELMIAETESAKERVSEIDKLLNSLQSQIKDSSVDVSNFIFESELVECANAVLDWYIKDLSNEKNLLVLKYGLPNQDVAEAQQDVEVTTQTKPLEQEDSSTAEAVSEVQQSEESESGLFDGLDEVSSDESAQAQGLVPEVDLESLREEATILEAQLKQYEETEEYELAAEVHERLLIIQAKLGLPQSD